MIHVQTSSIHVSIYYRRMTYPSIENRRRSKYDFPYVQIRESLAMMDASTWLWRLAAGLHSNSDGSTCRESREARMLIGVNFDSESGWIEKRISEGLKDWDLESSENRQYSVNTDGRRLNFPEIHSRYIVSERIICGRSLKLKSKRRSTICRPEKNWTRRSPDRFAKRLLKQSMPRQKESPSSEDAVHKNSRREISSLLPENNSS